MRVIGCKKWFFCLFFVHESILFVNNILSLISASYNYPGGFPQAGGYQGNYPQQPGGFPQQQQQQPPPGGYPQQPPRGW